MPYSATSPTTAEWDAFVRQHPRGHLLQLANWGALKADYGWRPVRVGLTDNRDLVAGAQILLRRLPFRLGTLAYLPYAPLVDWQHHAMVTAMMDALRDSCKKHRAAFLKAEPGHGIDPDWLRQAGFQPSLQTVQPPATVIIPLDDEENILKRMNQMTRRNIRKSEKQAVEVREGTKADVASFNAMLDETGNRQAFGVHVAPYYERAYDLFVPQGDAVLLIASAEGVDLAGVFIFKLGDQAWYLYGASRDVERQRMASFGAQWAGIQWALAHGCKSYDMYGIPNEDEAALEAQFETRHDGLWGVYRFKRGWGGEVKRTVGAWDMIFNRPIYWLYQLALKVRRSNATE